MKTLPLIILAILVGCQDKPKPATAAPIPNPYNGVYVSTRDNTDTIDFTPFRDSPTFNLNRAMDTTRTTPQPKSGFGYYRFEVKENKIKVDWCFASKLDTTWYTFQMKGDSLLIGNFYERERRGEVEVFVRSE